MTVLQFSLTLACLIIVAGGIGLQFTDHGLPWWLISVIALIPLIIMVIAEAK